jgi:hypothetical protein
VAGKSGNAESSGVQNDQVKTLHGENGTAAFDWVTERSSCSLPKVFSTLRMQVEEDVKTRNGLRPGNSPYEFSVTEDNGEFAVLLKALEVRTSVTFSLADHAVLVRDDQGNPIFEVNAAFDDKGRCRLKVNGEEREFWQVRRMALEELMFRGL